MLQQTQVERVIPYYKEWLRQFPTVRALARAPLSAVLRAWQGLGYNRRAKYLHRAAKAIVKEHNGVFPKTVEALEALPGIGPYTARAVAAFAYNQDVVVIETNVRTVIIHHCFPGKGIVEDATIASLLADVLPKGRAREWYSALMDYGSFLKRSGVRLNARGTAYAKQSAFAGSDREARGAILRILAKGARSGSFLTGILGLARRAQVHAQLTSLMKEGLVELTQVKFRLPR